MPKLGGTGEMRHNDRQPTSIFVGTIAEIVFLVLTIVVAGYIGRFGGPFDDWVRQGNLEGNQIVVLMYLAWSFLALGIVVRTPAVRYGFLACWIVLASLMHIYQEQNPIMNLVAALCVLIAVTLLNRFRQNQSRPNDSDE